MAEKLDVSAITNSRSRTTEPWIEPLVGWRRSVAWFAAVVVSWLLVAGIVTTVYELIAIWPEVVETLASL